MVRWLFFCLGVSILWAQPESEVAPPYNVKSVAFTQNGAIVVPYFRLGESFALEFDDLYGNEADYFYTITQYNYDWTPSSLPKQEYLTGMDNQRIITYKNSFNTLQIYSHYQQLFPNTNNTITKTGNYMIKVFNNENELVFSRKCIIYQEDVTIAALVKRSRDLNTIDSRQNLDITINTGNQTFQNPMDNIRIALFQNARWDNALYNIKPQYTLGSQLVYRYNTETQFYAGNEMSYWDSKNIRLASNSISLVKQADIYSIYLYTDQARKTQPYTYYPDINGNYVIRNLNAEDNDIQSDYHWVFVSLYAPEVTSDQKIYVTGMFNNYALTDEYKMDYNTEKGYYEKAFLAKQGFVNYQYTLVDANGQVNNEKAIDGNFWQTENNYFIIVYYRGSSERYDRVIGFGLTNSQNIRN